MTIGYRIRNLRETLGLSQIDVANTIGVSKQTLYKYEHDIVSNIPSDKIEALAHKLNTTPAYLMGWTETNDPQQNDRVMAYAKAILRNKILKEYMDKISELPEEYQNLALTSIDRIYDAYKLTEDIK